MTRDKTYAYCKINRDIAILSGDKKVRFCGVIN